MNPQATSGRRVTCVLSGGGAKAAAHVGAIRALHEAGLRPARFVGTSMGAVFAASFASGLEVEDVLRRMRGMTRRHVARPSYSLLLGLFARSILRAGPLRRTIARLVPATSFAELGVPLTVTSTDLATGALVLHGEGGEHEGGLDLHEALYATCALPVYYPPARHDGRILGDGGLRSVLPVAVAARWPADLVVAVSVGPSLTARAGRERWVAPMLRAHNRAMRILMAAQTESEVQRVQAAGGPPLLVIEPPREHGATFAVSAAMHYVEEGYRATRRALETWFARAGD